MKSLALLISLCALAAPAYAAAGLVGPKCEASAASGKCTYDVSLVELIARPDEFHGKVVRVIGYVRLEFEGNAIYLSKESYDAAISRNGLWIDPPAGSPLAKKGAVWGPRYAIVEGRFDASDHGHMGMFSGTITDTSRLDPWQ